MNAHQDLLRHVCRDDLKCRLCGRPLGEVLKHPCVAQRDILAAIREAKLRDVVAAEMPT